MVLLLQPIQLKLEEQRATVVMTRLVHVLDPDELRSLTVADCSPVHRFLFDSHGQLLYANERATHKWAAGELFSMSRALLRAGPLRISICLNALF